MAEEQLKKKIYDTLKNGYFQGPDDLVDVSDGDADNIHIVVVSRKLDGQYLDEKDDLIWSQLQQHLSQDELTRISLLIGSSPEEFKAI